MFGRNPRTSNTDFHRPSVSKSNKANKPENFPDWDYLSGSGSGS